MKNNYRLTTSIIIPTFNGKNLLKRSIPLLYKSLVSINSEVIIVDNNSTDGTEEMLTKKYPDIKHIKLDKNYGFTKAVNEGAKRAKGKYVLILNNDCYLEKNTITNLLSNTQKNKLTATQPVIYTINKKSVENIGHLIDTWKAKAQPIVDKDFVFDNINQRYIYVLSGTCLLIERKVFYKIGMFDESFHSYLEDVDLFIRLNKAGYKYTPTISASCIHAHMSTSSKMGLYKEKQDFKNWIRIISKNFKLKFIVKHFPTLFVERLRNLNGILKKMIR